MFKKKEEKELDAEENILISTLQDNLFKLYYLIMIIASSFVAIMNFDLEQHFFAYLISTVALTRACVFVVLFYQLCQGNKTIVFRCDLIVYSIVLQIIQFLSLVSYSIAVDVSNYFIYQFCITNITMTYVLVLRYLSLNQIIKNAKFLQEHYDEVKEVL